MIEIEDTVVVEMEAIITADKSKYKIVYTTYYMLL